MGPPLHFFMTRLLFVEKNKANSLKAKSDKAEVLIVVDNPRILPEQNAKSWPPIPSPPAAPDSPVPVEGWKGIRLGGCWINLVNNVNPPDLVSLGEDATANSECSEFSTLKLDDNDPQEESTPQAFEVQEEDVAAAAAKSVEKLPQLFPSNSARGSVAAKKPGLKLGSVKGLPRPAMKKKSSSKSASGMLKEGNSSGSGSAAED